MPVATDDYVSLENMCFWIDIKPNFDIDSSSKGARISPKIDPYMSAVFKWIYGTTIASR